MPDMQAVHNAQPADESALSRAAASSIICDQPLIGGEVYFIRYGKEGETPPSDDFLGLMALQKKLPKPNKLYRRVESEDGFRDVLLVTRT